MKETRIIDISRPVSSATAPWPGDTPVTIDWTMRIENGDIVNLGCLRGSPHVGTHTDAPIHVRRAAAAMDEIPLAAYIGPARVLAVRADEGGLIRPDAFEGIDLADPPRILLKTGTNPDPERFPERFAALSAGAARALVDGGAVLVGLDTPSVDAADSKDLAAHNTLLDGGVRWLENLDLSGAPEGRYRLVALPLRLVGADASPVRAVLLPE